MKVVITETDIRLAVKKNSHRCMIAEAIRRDINHAIRVVVDLQSIRWTDDQAGIRYFFFTPPVAQEALLAFDEGRLVKPFEFELRKPAQIRPQGFTASMIRSRDKELERKDRGRTRRSAPTDSELGPKEAKRQTAVKKHAQVKLRDTEREYGICRVTNHPLKKG
jgi:hypothetical protein